MNSQIPVQIKYVKVRFRYLPPPPHDSEYQTRKERTGYGDVQTEGYGEEEDTREVDAGVTEG